MKETTVMEAESEHRGREMTTRGKGGREHEQFG